MSQDRKTLVLFTAFYGLIVFIDYFTTVDDFIISFLPSLDGVLNNKGFYGFFNTNGHYLRGGFLGLFFIFAYNEIINMKLKAHDFDKKQYVIITLLLMLVVTPAFIFIKHLGLVQEIMLVLYPVLWTLSLIAIYHFAKAISTRKKIQGDETDLSGEKERKPVISFSTEGELWINVINPYQGTLIVGGAGAGKTASLGHPYLFQLVELGFSGVVYSYKQFDLANVVYSAYQQYPEIKDEVKLRIINFTNVHKSHRVNPIHPDYLKNTAFIDEFAWVILKNLNKEWIKKQDFFAQSAMLILKAVILFLYKKHPEFCTIPHAFTIINKCSAKQVVQMLNEDELTAQIVSSVAEGVSNEAGEQVAGVIASIKNITQKLINENLFWVLSGNDVNLNLNSPQDPYMLVLCNEPQVEDTISPIISLMVTVARKLMNVPGKRKSVFFLDEAPTLFIPQFDTLPNTGRSNLIASVFMCQDLSQMEDMYTEVGARKIRGSLGNTFFGNSTENKTLKYVEESFGKVDRIIENNTQGRSKSTGSNGQNDSVSYNVQERALIKGSDVSAFPIGHFCGKIIGNENKPVFSTRFNLMEQQTGINPEGHEIPDFSLMDPHFEDSGYRYYHPDKQKDVYLEGSSLDHSNIEVHENFVKIMSEVDELVLKYCPTELQKIRQQVEV